MWTHILALVTHYGLYMSSGITWPHILALVTHYGLYEDE